ncbi:DUF4913 domain-containing protein [Cryobacterium sp. TMT1-2-2]|uniref:DUF4913 domain-containing protein n=1 Tax=Cryobacterium sp. TMT1-2-2 TaxID=1259233 RepID=UPI002102F162|nr:DUF4913 domain-containing protein [Cryobacterium sp. TMT1-2-2]
MTACWRCRPFPLSWSPEISDIAFSQAREALHLKLTFGMSVWWRDHADHHMRLLTSPEGPFATSRARNSDRDPSPLM